MSFILDALRKSEHERQRQASPGLAELRPAMARWRFPLWAIALGALLAVNLVVLTVLMLSNGDQSAPASLPLAESQSAPSSASTAPAAGSPSPSSSTTAMLSGTSPTRASGSPATDQHVADEPVRPRSDLDVGAEEDAATLEEFAEDEADEMGPELQPPPRAASNDEESAARLPTIDDMALRGTALPELHLDIHVYATQPAERFVFLNNRKYREGGEMPEGTVIERITRDGVVLNHRGVRFLLPRQ